MTDAAFSASAFISLTDPDPARFDREERRRLRPAKLGRRGGGASAREGRLDDSPLDPPFSTKLTVLERRRTLGTLIIVAVAGHASTLRERTTEGHKADAVMSRYRRTVRLVSAEAGSVAAD